MFDKQENGLI